MKNIFNSQTYSLQAQVEIADSGRGGWLLSPCEAIFY